VTPRDEIRTWVLIQGKSQRSAARHFGLSRQTVAQLLEEAPTNERRSQRPVQRKAPVREMVLPQLEHWLA
jgi:transposase